LAVVLQVAQAPLAVPRFARRSDELLEHARKAKEAKRLTGKIEAERIAKEQALSALHIITAQAPLGGMVLWTHISWQRSDLGWHAPIEYEVSHIGPNR